MIHTDFRKILVNFICFYFIKANEVNIPSNLKLNYFQKLKPSIGEIWPKVKFEKRFEYHLIDPHNFAFEVAGKSCDILDEAIVRYKQIIIDSIKSPIRDTQKQLFGLNLVTKITVNLSTICEHFPHLDMDESYKISGADYISANSIWGVLRGLETYSQAIIPTFEGMLRVPNLIILDSPRFPHRGLLLDTARHYIKVNTILRILDGMVYNKLNVFHWHIVDDESFPYQSIKYPELSEKGAFMPSMIYTQDNIANIIDYARMRGIRVIPEFDVPGHSKSWGKSHPELLTSCGPSQFGPLNPLKKRTYRFIENLFSEIMNVFHDKYIHLGGDEVDISCWELHRSANYYTNSIASDPLLYIKSMFMAKVSKILTQKSYFPIVWQEAMESNTKMPDETIVQVWKDSNWEKVLHDITASGYRVLYSQCWYLDRWNADGHWQTYYSCDPLNFNGDAEQKKLVIGGEACMWGEHVDDGNITQQIFPRVSAIAEKLWSSLEGIPNLDAVEQRLQEHTYRMEFRGLLRNN